MTGKNDGYGKALASKSQMVEPFKYYIQYQQRKLVLIRSLQQKKYTVFGISSSIFLSIISTEKSINFIQ